MTNSAESPLYGFSSSSTMFSTRWVIYRLRDDKEAMTGKKFGRRHEQRAWNEMQRVAERFGYAN